MLPILVAVSLAGNLFSALSAYALLLAGRVITALAHGSFFAIGAIAATRLAPRAKLAGRSH